MSKNVHFGSGQNIFNGWDNLDKRFTGDKSQRKFFIPWTAPAKFPYKDGSVSYMFTEHFLEHMDEQTGFEILKDSYRVMEKGGVLRICVPSLDKYVDLFLNWKEKHDNRDFRNGTQFLNYAIYGESWKNSGRVRYLKKDSSNSFLSPIHDHRYIYSEDDLISKLKEVGFSKAYIVEWGKSEYKDLQGREHHHNLAELIVEAVK